MPLGRPNSGGKLVKLDSVLRIVRFLSTMPLTFVSATYQLIFEWKSDWSGN